MYAGKAVSEFCVSLKKNKQQNVKDIVLLYVLKSSICYKIVKISSSFILTEF